MQIRRSSRLENAPNRGDLEKPEPVEAAARLSISLLHATYRRPGGSSEVYAAWAGAAVHPERVEYIVAADEGDECVTTVDGPVKVIELRNPPDSNWSTAVRNWNAAARQARGDLLVVIADDLFPAERWDADLDALCSGMNPNVIEFVVKVGDGGTQEDELLRHPVVSRRFYVEYGLFHPQLRGVYCDDEITTRAFWKAFILDGRSVQLNHHHPTLGEVPSISESQRRINRRQEYDYGLMVYRSTWPRWRRLVGASPISKSLVEGRSTGELVRVVRAHRRRKLVRLPLLAAAAVFRRVRPREQSRGT